MTGICLDRLLKQRFALRKPDFFLDLPPPRGGLRSLSAGADCIATESRAPSELLSQARQTPSAVSFHALPADRSSHDGDRSPCFASSPQPLCPRLDLAMPIYRYAPLPPAPRPGRCGFRPDPMHQCSRACRPSGLRPTQPTNARAPGEFAETYQFFIRLSARTSRVCGASARRRRCLQKIVTFG